MLERRKVIKRGKGIDPDGLPLYRRLKVCHHPYNGLGWWFNGPDLGFRVLLTASSLSVWCGQYESSHNHIQVYRQHTVCCGAIGEASTINCLLADWVHKCVGSFNVIAMLTRATPRSAYPWSNKGFLTLSSESLGSSCQTARQHHGLLQVSCTVTVFIVIVLLARSLKSTRLTAELQLVSQCSTRHIFSLIISLSYFFYFTKVHLKALDRKPTILIIV